MNCEKTQELILTDYADGRLAGDQKVQLETHLAGCVHCREFARVVNEKILQPFAQAERLSPSESVWNKIREEIAQEEPVSSFRSFIRFIGSLKPLQGSVLLYSALLVLVTLTVLRVKPAPDGINIAVQTTAPVTIAKIEVKENLPAVDYDEEYLAFMVDEFAGNYAPYNDGYGTAIEEYFL
ncbi:MAG: zf-HC2 domain-containing protein [Candidatus Omnitrophota bacterium]